MNATEEKYIGILEFTGADSEPDHMEVIKRGNCLVFGRACNVGLLESGYMQIEEGESMEEALQELHADLEVYYNDGPGYVSRIIRNECM